MSERLEAAALALKISKLKLGIRFERPIPMAHPHLTEAERDLIVRALTEYSIKYLDNA